MTGTYTCDKLRVTGSAKIAGAVVPTISSTSTFTNKRWTRRITTETSAGSPTINTDNTDEHRITAQAGSIASFTTNLSGTPTDGQVLVISITPTSSTNRTIAWGTGFAGGDTPLPTETGTTTLVVMFKIIANVSSTVWQCIAWTHVG